ncbi:oligomeric complex COG6 [Gloeophyllum trabeum ATCC 11539]|uniref:Conserved oligomeric Golgi complex subunit 6 n=1 Tax=Gloeophyllum trabeum (strain ATCC 11539 / FP-39264 / Madison 617) TaxID=670483 RepID=S7RT37_GLOTA|nr:oligomeric complex COG6 [Gloeophyllum trabeum ATCC 11539]EPQ57850.1 oligomeric complex COG6 [Gloeophyllum trabeum ATCC 11539]
MSSPAPRPSTSPLASRRLVSGVSPSHSPSQARNPVSLRLYKVLGAGFEDEATKEALRTVSELYGASNAAGSKTTNVNGNAKPIAGSSEDSDELDSDEDERSDTDEDEKLSLGPYLSRQVVAPTGAAARARKNLRRDIDLKLASSSRKFLKALGEVDQKLDALQEHITSMRTQCDEAHEQLQTTNEACKSLLDQAGNLRQERDMIATQQTILNLFLSRFTLSSEEVTALTSRDVPPGKLFFTSMDKATKVREDCRVLMGVDGPTKAGLDIIAATFANLEQAYEKIFRYLVSEFQTIGRGNRDRERSVDPDANLEASPILKEAVRRLRSRPELLSEALGALSQTRQSTLLATFLDALTRGGPSGLPRPIELHAHDPLRYIGDMLAWVHQAIAAEREFMESLFGLGREGESSRRMIGSVRRFEKGKMGETEEWIGEVVDRNVGKLCGPLRVRVQQTVRSQERPILAFKIANLLHFYALTMRRTIGEDAALSQALGELSEMSYKVFFDAIEAQGRALLRDLDDSALSPPATVEEHMQTLREILSVYESSRLDDPSDTQPEEDGKAETSGGQSHFGVERILEIMINPALEVCLTAAEDKKRSRPTWDKSVFVLNCLTYLQGVLEPYPFASAEKERLDALVEERVNDLVNEHYLDILRDAGLDSAVAVLETKAPGDPLSRIEATQPNELSLALQKFSNWLSGLEVVHSPRLSRLTVQRLHSRIHQAALTRVANAYRKLCEEVRKPENKYEAASTLLGGQRPFGQIHLLNQIFGLGDEGE